LNYCIRTSSLTVFLEILLVELNGFRDEKKSVYEL
jgi:hypothetical protein